MKRLLDILIAGLALIVFAPVLLLVAVMVRVKLGSPVLFRQLRPGFHGAPFMMNKFRTMSNAVGPDGQLLPDADRLTRFGHFLRASSSG